MNKKNMIFLVFVALVLNIQAVQVKKVEAGDYADFQKGELKGTCIDSRGQLSLGPVIEEIKGPAGEFYLSMATGNDGNLYVGTGHKSELYRINPTTKSVELVFQSEQLDFYALLVRQSNDIFVGSSPNGKIYHIGKDQKAKVVFDPEERFIWDMKEDRSGNIFCALGNSGGVYQIKESGEAIKIFDAEDSHLISLYITRDNSILAGSGDRGILYKIDDRKVKVLYDSPLEEIRGICEDPDGNIYFSASKGIDKKKSYESGELESFFSSQEIKKSPDPREKSILYCLHTNGTTEQIWSSTEDYIYSICFDKKNNNILVGTGNSGRIFRVKKDGFYSLVYESESAQIFKIIENRNGFYVLGNNTASIINLSQNLNAKGLYVSEVYDLAVQSRFGKIYWDADVSSGMQVSFFVRMGNSNIADKTWTDWSAPFTDSQNSNIDMDGFRYFQIQIMFNSSNIGGTPSVNHYRVFYLQKNLKPQIKYIRVIKPEAEKNGIKKNKSDRQPAGETLEVKWQANDPNHDVLKSTVYIKKKNDRGWIPFKKNISVNKVDILTAYYEDGLYELKLVVDDSLSNPPLAASSTTMISKPFIIDSTAPELIDMAVQGDQIKFNVRDKTSIVAEVLYSFDGEIWYPLIPVDMITDSKVESFVFKVPSDSSSKIVFFKISDEYHNSKVYQREL
jgi:hypothetical protein